MGLIEDGLDSAIAETVSKREDPFVVLGLK
jgi:hypothetical protein